MIKIICSSCKSDKVKLIHDPQGISLIQCNNPDCLDYECVVPLYELDDKNLEIIED